VIGCCIGEGRCGSITRTASRCKKKKKGQKLNKSKNQKNTSPGNTTSRYTDKK
jgi:hypothetical protein